MLALYVHAIALTSRFRRDTKAVTALEYGLIAAIMSIVIIAGFNALSGGLSATLARITAALT